MDIPRIYIYHEYIEVYMVVSGSVTVVMIVNALDPLVGDAVRMCRLILRLATMVEPASL